MQIWLYKKILIISFDTEKIVCVCVWERERGRERESVCVASSEIFSDLYIVLSEHCVPCLVHIACSLCVWRGLNVFFRQNRQRLSRDTWSGHCRGTMGWMGLTYDLKPRNLALILFAEKQSIFVRFSSRIQKPRTQNLEPKTQNPNPKTENWKPKPENRKPETLNPKP